MRWSFFYILFVCNCSISLYATEWTEGTPLPESLAIVRTVAQLMEQAETSLPKPKSTIRHPSSNPAKLFPNFTAANFADSGVVPPDAMGVVGPSQFILAANGIIRSFDKATGDPDHVLNISTSNFFRDITKGVFTSDSRIRYDRFSDRWVILILAAGLKPISVMLAVSDSGKITNQTKWSIFNLASRSDANADYPTIGIDKHALYIGVNIMQEPKGYVTSDAFVIPKTPLLEGKLRAYVFQNLVVPGKIVGPTTPQGVDNFDAHAEEGYLIGLDGMGDRLMLRRIKNPAGRPSISENIPIPIGKLASPLLVPQKGSLASKKFFLQGFDKRLSSPHIRNKHLYTAHNVGINNLGGSEDPTRDGCKWYDIDLNDPDHPLIAQSGTLFQPSHTNDKEERYFWTPGIMTNGLHTLMICCSVSGDQDYANAAYAMRYANDPPGTLQKPQLFTDSHVIYTLGFPPFENLRWGEYSHVSLDPFDQLTFWNIAEFALAPASWGLQVARIPAPPPAAVVSVTPSIIREGQTNVLVKIKGEGVAGSGFYDPGEGFPNRLKVEIEDANIQSIKWISPTEIDLVISNVKIGSSPSKTITITNPDGQRETSKGLLRVLI